MGRPDVVATPRLDLVPLSAALVAALVDGDLAGARDLAPFPVDAGTFAADVHVLCRALFAWGAEHGARTVVASVAPANAASLATIARLGFVRTGEQVDDVDGLEQVHTLRLT